MGIKKLNKFLEDRGLIKEHTSLSAYTISRGKIRKFVLGVDFLLYLHKYHHSCGSVIGGFWNQIIKLLSRGVLPVYVVDGISIPEKKGTLEKRARRDNAIRKEIESLKLEAEYNENSSIIREKIIKLEKKKSKVSKSVLNSVFKLLDLFNIPYYHADTEADFLAIKLFKSGYIDGYLSEDTDMLPLGCDSLIKIKKGNVYEYNIEYILEELELELDSFIDMCIFFGCDYLKHEIRVDRDYAYNLFKKYGNLEDIFENADDENVNINNSKLSNLVDNYYSVKDIFVNYYKRESLPDSISLKFSSPLEIDKIMEYAYNNNIIIKKSQHSKTTLVTLRYINNHIKVGLFP